MTGVTTPAASANRLSDSVLPVEALPAAAGRAYPVAIGGE